MWPSKGPFCDGPSDDPEPCLWLVVVYRTLRYCCSFMLVTAEWCCQQMPGVCVCLQDQCMYVADNVELSCSCVCSSLFILYVVVPGAPWVLPCWAAMIWDCVCMLVTALAECLDRAISTLQQL
jgi:hypothetical protein